METITKHLEDLVAFHVVASGASFTSAAEALGTSKATVSKQVQRLEAYLGTQLFQRSTRRVRLTEEGKTLLGFSERILALSDEAGRKMRDLLKGDEGTIRISTPVSFGEAFFPTFLPQMRKQLPKITFDADLTNEDRDFRQDELDFAIRATDTPEPELVGRYLGKLRDVICCAPQVAKRVEGEDPRVLNKHECIRSSLESTWNDWMLVSKKEEVRVRVQGRIVTNQYSMARDYVKAGLGIARIPYYLIAKDLDSGELVQLFPKHEIATHPLYLIYAKGSFTSRRHKLARDGILEWFKARPEIFI